MSELLRKPANYLAAQVAAEKLSEQFLKTAMTKYRLNDPSQVKPDMILKIAGERNSLLDTLDKLIIVVFPTQKENLNEHNAVDNLLGRLVNIK